MNDSLTANDLPIGVNPVNFFNGDLFTDLAATSRGGAADRSPGFSGGAIGFKASGSLAEMAPTSVNVQAAPAVTIAEGASAEIAGASAQSVTFTGTTGTLKLGDALAFTGQVSGLAGADAIDLADVSYGVQTQVTYSGNTTGGTLTITDGIHTANISLQGNYLSSTWTLASDGSGGTTVVDPVSTNTWQALPVGAGGFLDGMSVADDGTMVVRTDTYGAYKWNGTEWVQLVTAASMPAALGADGNGLYNDGVYSIQVAPSNSNVMYMVYPVYQANVTPPNSGVYVSTNGGETWTLTSFPPLSDQTSFNANGPYRMWGPTMAIDPVNPNIAYVGTGANGLFVTTNGGSTWTSVSGVPTGLSDGSGNYPGITGVVFDPGNPNIVFAASYGNGVYETTNGGTSWSKVSGGPSSVEFATISSNGTYYVIDQNHNLWVDTSGTWTEPLSNVAGVAVDPFNANHVVVTTYQGQLNESFNGGGSWGGWSDNGFNSPNLVANDVPYEADFGPDAYGLTFSPTTPGVLITNGDRGSWTTTLSGNITPSTVITWTDQSIGVEQLVANEIIVPPVPNAEPLLASWDTAVLRVNGTQNATTSDGPINVLAAGWSIDYASSDPSFIVVLADGGYAGGPQASSFSTNAGQTWTALPTIPPGGSFGGEVAVSTPQNFIFADAGGNQPYYTLNGGETWTPITLPGVSSWSNFMGAYYVDERVIAADRVDPNTFYLFYNGVGLFSTTNGGVTWTLASSTVANTLEFAFDPQLETTPGEAGDLWIASGQNGNPGQSGQGTFGNLLHSTNGGVTWTTVANVTEPYCIGFGAAAPGQTYPAIYMVGSVNGVFGIWQSINEAQSWTLIGTAPEGSLDTIKTITGDPNVFGKVYVGFAGSGYAVYSADGPSILEVDTSPSSGTGQTGSVVTLTLAMSEVATVSGGTPTLTLNDGGTATYTGGSGTDALTFTYTVGAGQNTSALAATAVNLNGATIADSGGNAANLTLSGLTQTGPSINGGTAGATPTSLVETPSTGDLNAGKTVTLTLDYSGAITVAGGTPTLTLNDGGTATYIGGSGTSALTFSYTVGAGQNTASLAATAINLNGATMKDGSGNAVNLSLTGLSQTGPQIDTTTPVITSITETPSTGDLNAGKTVVYTLNLNEVVTLNSAGGTPTLTLNDGGTATYTGGSGTNWLTFSYTVLAGQNTPDLTVSSVNLNGATLQDGAGNTANMSLTGLTQGSPQIDTTPPTVSSVAATAGDYNVGSVLTLTLNMSEAVAITGTPTLTLNDGGTATYAGGSGTSALTFSYTVGSGQNVAGLAVTAINGSIADLAGNALSTANLPETFTGVVIDTTGPAGPTVSSVVASGAGITSGTGDLGVGSVVTLTVNLSEAATVAGGTPTLTLNDGGTATYTGGSGSNALTFSYTVGAGQNTADLAVTAVNLNSATVKDSAGTAANLSGAVTPPAGTLQIDTTAPTVASVVTSGTGITAGSGDLAAGSVVTLTVNLSSAVTVAGGTPTLTLNDGGTATYTGGSGSNALTFSYTVAAGQNTADLAVTAVNLNSATVKDGAGNAANLTGAVTTPAGTLQIDTTGSTASAAPSAVSMVASGAGITAGSGDVGVGSVVTITLNLSEAVTVAGGTPTMTLNDGGTATYTGGSGSNALTFSYTVAAGQNTADLAVTAGNLNSATIVNSAGVSLTGAITNFTGTLQIDTTTPSVSSVVASGTGISSGTGDVGVGSVVTLTVNMSSAVTVVGGTPTLTLNDGGTATYTGGSGSNALTFSYTVGAGQDTSDLAVTAVNLGAATVKDGAGNAANLTGAVTSPAGTLQIDTTTPSVSSVVASGSGITAGSGDLGVGSVVTLTVNLSEAVTVAGGTPTLTLNDGGTATYTGGSGSNALTFKYTVAAGQNTADLAVTAVNLGAATVKNGAGTAANLTGAVTAPAGTLQIDTTTPSVSSVVASGAGITSGAGDLGVGSVVTLTVNLSEAVTVAGGTPTLTLNDGGTATYTGGSGSNALTFSYTVAAGQNTADLAVTAVNLGAATVKNGAGTAANLSGAVTTPAGTLQIDTTGPTVSSVATSGTGITAGSGDLAAGSVVTLTVNLSSAVTVAGGTPTLTLNDGGTATYTGGSGSNALTFKYTVAAGQNTADLAVTAVNLGAATVKDAAGNAANLSGAVTTPAGTLQIDTTTPVISSIAETPSSGDLNAGKTVTYTLNLNEAVTVNTTGGSPTLTLNDGGIATYIGGSGTNALTFSYTVLAGQNTPDLTVSSVNLNGATLRDGAGNTANLSLAGLTQGSPEIDTTAPTVASVVATGTGITAGSGDLGVGSVVTLTVNLSEAVTVAGGTPTLTLNDGGTATYSGGSGSNALTFKYTVGAGQNTADLAVTAVNLNSATVKDGAGNAANLTGAVTTPAGTLQIDTTAPTVASVVASGTGITAGSGDLGVGSVVTLTVNLSSAVTVAGGTPTLTLNDGGTATYTGGSGSNALTFSYTVAAGQNTADLTVTAVNLNSATVKDGAGNGANLTGAVTTPAGTLQIDTAGSTGSAAPSVVSMVASGAGITAGSGDVGVGSVVTITLNLSEAVTVAGGTPTLTLNDGGTATYTGGSGTNALTFSYTVAAGQNTADLAVTGGNLNAATIENSAGASVTSAITNLTGTLQIDTTGPTVSSVVASGTGITAGTGDLGVGSVVTLTVNLSSAVTVAGGTPTLTLNDGGTATYTGGSGSNALTFKYTVAAGQNTADLAVKTVNLNSAIIKDGVGNAANLTGAVTTAAGTLQIDTTTPVISSIAETPSSGDLNAGKTVTYTLNLNEAVKVNTTGGSPTLALSDGGTATYVGGSGSKALTFSYTVLAGQNAPDLTVSSVNLNGATLQDGAGNTANLSLTGLTQGSPQIDTTTPSVSSVVASGSGITSGTGDLGVGSVVTLTVNLSEAVTVAGGTPTLTLNDGGTATYTGGSGSNALTFKYTVAAGQNTADLAVTAVNLGAATVKNGAGTAANLTGAVTNPAGTLQIGPVTTVIQTDGSTSLVQGGRNYYLFSTGTDTGPELKDGGVVVTAGVGVVAGWTAIGAVQVAGGGYDVAWENASAGLFSVWSVGSNGNYLSNLVTHVSGNSAALETLETVFHQDLNGDGVIGLYAAPSTNLKISSALSGTSGSATIGTGATLELAAADSASITFSSSTGMLKLDKPSTFSGTIFDFTGNGTLSGSDQIDLKGINFNSVHDSYSNGVLTVTDGTHTDKLDFSGSYTLANFKFASDGSGGTIVYDPPVLAGKSGNTTAENLTSDSVVSALNQQLALWSQHMASAFPSSAFGNEARSMASLSELGDGQLAPPAQPVAIQHHA